MPVRRRALLHANGPALWPEHRPLSEVLRLQGETPAPIWKTTYQGEPTAPRGSTFLRGWWRDQNRYDPADRGLVASCVARWLSWDTALKDTETSAYTAVTVGELTPDYRLIVREVWRDRLIFPDLPETIAAFARRYNQDGKLRGIVIEDAASGTSAYQTLRASAADWVRGLLVAFMPVGDKEQRASQVAVWCRNGCVLLPHPGVEAAWLVDFEDELFSFPGSAYKDQVDSFVQLLLYTEHVISEGWHARRMVQKADE
jgi:predicted phage terminase large subunit-like protein